jgi:energy-coupling factor transporter ATP-binding protein EcfA2
VSGRALVAEVPRPAAAAAPYGQVLDALDTWIGRAARLFPGVARAEPDLRAALAQVRARGERLEAPLFVLLAGGTGAGKSTLLNALAGGEPIAATSAIRPTTTALTCYYHLESELAIPGELLDGARRAPHRRAALRDKVILDAPDFDSSVRENEARHRRALAAADLVVLVATPEKYAGADLFALLEEHRRGRSFVFVLNRLDQGVAPEVAADFRRELERAGFAQPTVLVLSALAALRAKRGDPEPGPQGDFPRLEALIEEELTRARAREIKRLNLDELVLRLLERAAEHVPPDLADRVARWRLSAAAIAGEAHAAVGESLARGVVEDEALAREVRGRIATGYGGLFGFYQALHWAVRALGGRGLAGAAVGRVLAPPQGGSAAGEEPLRAPPPGEDPLPGAVLLAADRIDDIAVELAFARPTPPLDAASALRLVDRARAAARAELTAALDRAHAPASGSRRVESFLYNAPPLAVLGYALVTWCLALARGEIIGASWFLAAGLAAVTLLATAGMLADRIAARRAARVVDSLARAAREIAEREVQGPLMARLAEAAGEVQGAAKALADLREEAARLRRPGSISSPPATA